MIVTAYASYRDTSGTRWKVSRRPSDLLDLLTQPAIAQDPAAEQQQRCVILGTMDGPRGKDAWRSASHLALDLDWLDVLCDPASSDAHQEIPQQHWAIIDQALAERLDVPGLAYRTPRGVRVLVPLAEDIHDEADYAHLAEVVTERVLTGLDAGGVPLWRQGRDGLRPDPKPPWQLMRSPWPGWPVVQTGREDRPIDGLAIIELAEDRLDLDAALPPRIAAVVRHVADAVQMPREIVACTVLAITSAVIGNSRHIAQGGRRPRNLALSFLVGYGSGEGKGEIERELTPALEPITRQVTLTAKRLRDEHRAYRWAMSGYEAAAKEAARKGKPLTIDEPQRTWSPEDGGPRLIFRVTETTQEALIDDLRDSPRGIYQSAGEAQAILGMLGRYADGSSARGTDAARLRQIQSGEDVRRRLAGREDGGTCALGPHLSILAVTQSKLLRGLFVGEDQSSGTIARWLFCDPPEYGRRLYRPGTRPPPVSDEDRGVLRWTWQALYDLPIQVGAEDGRPAPTALLHLSAEADDLYGLELERLDERKRTVDADDGIHGHLRGHLLGLAGVVALLRDHAATTVTVEDMQRAIVLGRYYLGQAEDLFQAPCEVREEHRERRLAALRQRCEQILAKQPKKGVRPSDLRHNRNHRRYGGDDGRCRAIADLHAIGWVPRVPPAPPVGRPPVPGFFPPAGTPDTHSERAAKSAKGGGPPDGGGLGPLAARADRGSEVQGTATDLIRRASSELVRSGLHWPTDRAVKKPGPCPACGSETGFRLLGDDRWHCQSQRHGVAGGIGGSPLDLAHLLEQGQLPSAAEAAAYARRVLGMPSLGEAHQAPRPRVTSKQRATPLAEAPPAQATDAEPVPDQPAERPAQETWSLRTRDGRVDMLPPWWHISEELPVVDCRVPAPSYPTPCVRARDIIQMIPEGPIRRLLGLVVVELRIPNAEVLLARLQVVADVHQRQVLAELHREWTELTASMARQIRLWLPSVGGEGWRLHPTRARTMNGKHAPRRELAWTASHPQLEGFFGLGSNESAWTPTATPAQLERRPARRARPHALLTDYPPEVQTVTDMVDGEVVS